MSKITTWTMSEQSEQVSATLVAMSDVLVDTLVGVYLHGSAASVRLRPQSDIDLLAIVEHPLREDPQDALLTACCGSLAAILPSRTGGAALR